MGRPRSTARTPGARTGFAVPLVALAGAAALVWLVRAPLGSAAPAVEK